MIQIFEINYLTWIFRRKNFGILYTSIAHLFFSRARDFMIELSKEIKNVTKLSRDCHKGYEEA